MGRRRGSHRDVRLERSTQSSLRGGRLSPRGVTPPGRSASLRARITPRSFKIPKAALRSDAHWGCPLPDTDKAPPRVTDARLCMPPAAKLSRYQYRIWHKSQSFRPLERCPVLNPSGDDGCEIRHPQSDVPRPASTPDTIALVLLCQ